jgi:hypothetical protein
MAVMGGKVLLSLPGLLYGPLLLEPAISLVGAKTATEGWRENNA